MYEYFTIALIFGIFILIRNDNNPTIREKYTRKQSFLAATIIGLVFPVAISYIIYNKIFKKK